MDVILPKFSSDVKAITSWFKVPALIKLSPSEIFPSSNNTGSVSSHKLWVLSVANSKENKQNQI